MHPIKNYIIDMDGVLIKGTGLIPGANNFVVRLRDRGKGYLVLTNNSLYTPKDLSHRLQVIGLDIDPDYVVLGETSSYQYETITKAIRLIEVVLNLSPRIRMYPVHPSAAPSRAAARWQR